MRYFSYNELGVDVPTTVSEDHIRETYYDYWLEQITKKYGENHDFCFLDCIEDWMIVYWAWEVDL